MLAATFLFFASEPEMAGRYLVWIASGLFIAGLLICYGYAAIEPAGQGAKVNTQMVTAAKEALKATQAVENVGQANVEDVYRWSLRVVKAEHFSAQSVKDHAALMQHYHDRTVAMNRAGAPGGEEQTLFATKYYLAEAKGFVGE